MMNRSRLLRQTRTISMSIHTTARYGALLTILGMLLMPAILASDVIVLIIGASIHTQASVLFSAYWIRNSFTVALVGFLMAVIGSILE